MQTTTDKVKQVIHIGDIVVKEHHMSILFLHVLGIKGDMLECGIIDKSKSTTKHLVYIKNINVDAKSTHLYKRINNEINNSTNY